MKVNIRNFGRHDISPCVLIIASTLGWDDALIALEHFKDYFTNSGFERLFVAEEMGIVVGVCGAFSCDEYPAGLCGLHWFAVEPNFQGKGIGKALLTKSEECAQGQFNTMFVQSFTKAKGFYLKNGFKPETPLIAEPMKETEFLTKPLLVVKG